MIIVDFNKAARRGLNRRRVEMSSRYSETSSILSRIANLQRMLDAGKLSGDEKRYFESRRKLNNLLFAVVADDVGVRERR